MLGVLGDYSDDFVFLGSCALALYAREQGHVLTATKDVDCISLMPLPDYLQFFAELAAPGGPLIPEPQVQCRYRLRESALFVDIMEDVDWLFASRR